MRFAALYGALPIALLAATVVAVMLAVAFRRSHTVVTVLSVLGLTASLISALGEARAAPGPVTPLLFVDGVALFFMGLFLIVALAVIALSHSYLERQQVDREEFYILLVLATLGAGVVVMSSHFASFFLGLEVLSVSLYGLIAYLRTRERGIEASVKYLVLAAASAGFLLFGMALVYAALGTMEFARIGAALSNGSHSRNLLLTTGIAMTIVGVGFKLAVAPFHMWSPDVYEGAPAPVAAFVATVSKGAMFVLAMRYLGAATGWSGGPLDLAFAAVSIASMFAGNLLALLQDNIKRILAYSSIAHLGYLLVALLAGNDLGSVAVAFYLAVYSTTTLAAFGVVGAISRPERDADAPEDYRGLFWRRPLLAGLLTLMLLSLAGIPPTAGFFAKFYVLAAGVDTSLWVLVLVLIASSVIGLYYYLRLIVTMLLPVSNYEQAAEGMALSWAAGAVLAVSAVVVIGLGVYPTPLIEVIQSLAARSWG